MAEPKLTAKLALDNSEFKRKLAESNEGVKTFGSKIGSAASVLSKLGAVAAVTGVAFKGFKAIMQSSEGTADKWNFVMDASKNTLQEFGRRLATLDFSNLINGLRDSFREAKKLAELKDQLSEAGAFAKLGIEELRTKGIQKLQDIYSSENADERKRNKTEYLAIQEEILTKTKALADETLRIEKAKWEQENKIDVKYAEENYRLFSDYFFNKKGELEKYNRYLSKLAKDVEPLDVMVSAEVFGVNSQIAQRLYEYYKGAEKQNAPQALAKIIEDYTNSVNTANQEYAAALRKTKELFLETGDVVLSRTNPLQSLSTGNITLPGFGKKPNQQLAGRPTDAIKDITLALQAQQEAVNILANSFTALFTSTDKGFKNMINEMIAGLEKLVAELLARAAVFGILTILSGGNGGLAKIASQLLGGRSLGQFIGGVDKVVAAPIGMGQIKPISNAINVNLTGGISGRDWKLMNQRNL